MGAGYIKRKNFNDFVPRYTDTYTKEMDEEGLSICISRYEKKLRKSNKVINIRIFIV